eukprot:1181952-Prorocentrum_minimum.AAC.1
MYLNRRRDCSSYPASGGARPAQTRANVNDEIQRRRIFGFSLTARSYEVLSYSEVVFYLRIYLRIYGLDLSANEGPARITV